MVPPVCRPNGVFREHPPVRRTPSASRCTRCPPTPGIHRTRARGTRQTARAVTLNDAAGPRSNGRPDAPPGPASRQRTGGGRQQRGSGRCSTRSPIGSRRSSRRCAARAGCPRTTSTPPPRDPDRAARGRCRAPRGQDLHRRGQGTRQRCRGRAGAQPGPAGRQDRQRGAHHHPRRRDPAAAVRQEPADRHHAGRPAGRRQDHPGRQARPLAEGQGHTPLLVAADLQRPNAVNQLQVVGRRPASRSSPAPRQPPRHRSRVGPTRCGRPPPVSRRRGAASTTSSSSTPPAGWASTPSMMPQAADIRDAVSPDEILFVVDAMIGQDAVTTAQAFPDRVGFSGVVLTKLDSDARGGAALSVRYVTGQPILFASTGEKLDRLRRLPSRADGSRILGMGDMLTLIEQAERTFDADAGREDGRQDRVGQRASPSRTSSSRCWRSARWARSPTSSACCPAWAS